METPRIRAQCLGWGFASALRLLSATWRIDCAEHQVLDRLVECRERHILAFWHRHYITLFRLFRNQSIIALTNQSHRGQVIANICRRNEIETLQVRGNGMKQTLRSLATLANGNLGLAITVDGPVGPACEVKPVVLHLAARLGWPIVPLSVAAGCKHVCASRWDRLEIPHILSRVSFVIGKPIHVAQSTSHSDLRELATQLKKDIDRGTSIALERVSERL